MSRKTWTRIDVVIFAFLVASAWLASDYIKAQANLPVITVIDR